MVRLFLLWILLLSLITFILYGIDKRRARRGKWRIAEKTLFLFGFAGGAVGGFAGMQLFRHKTKHASFWFVNCLGILLHTALLILFAIKGWW